MQLQRIKVSLVKEVTPTYQVRSGADVVKMLRDKVFKDDPREMMVAVYLNSQHKLIGTHIVSVGIVNSAPFHPREVFAPGLVMNAVSLVLAHNHPSGDPTPSHDDREGTDRLMSAGELLGVTALDHVVIGENRFYSFADRSIHNG